MKRFFVATCTSLLTLLFLISCENTCKGEMQVLGTQKINASVSGDIVHLDYPDLIEYIDSSGNRFQFRKIVNQVYTETKVDPYTGECDNGNMFIPFYYREAFELSYASDDLDTISIIIKPQVISFIARAESDLMPDSDVQHGLDFFNVRLSLNGCDVVDTGRFLSDGQGISVVNTVPFGRRKFNQLYNDTYGLRAGWSNDVWFSFSKGIVAFNYCGKNFAQIIE